MANTFYASTLGLPKELDKFFVGFDPLVQKLAEAAEQTTKLVANYPPYNIKKIDENKYVIEMAVAGFAKQDIEIELADGKLIIKGNTQSGEPAEKDSKGEWTWPHFIYHGLAMRPFTRQFTLAEHVEINGAELLNGILRVGLEYIIPEHKKPKKINIHDHTEKKSAEGK
jgi:molecular chaperone IbpA